MRHKNLPLLALAIASVACADRAPVTSSSPGTAGASATAGASNANAGSRSIDISDAGTPGAATSGAGTLGADAETAGSEADAGAAGADAGTAGANAGTAGVGGSGTPAPAGYCEGSHPAEGCVDTMAIEAFSDSVYVVSGGDLQAFWPTLAPSQVRVATRAEPLAFEYRISDQSIFYSTFLDGVYQHQDPGPDTLVPMPDCPNPKDRAWRWPAFGFDGCGAFYYQCGDTIRRSDGELLTNSISGLGSVLLDGRLILSMPSETTNTGNDFAVLGPTGAELSRLNPRAQLSGTFGTDLRATTVSGDHAYVLFSRVNGAEKTLLAYRVTEHNVWQRVRSVPIADSGLQRLVISDGTIFVLEDYRTSSYTQVRAFLPNGEVRVVWGGYSGSQLLVGPRVGAPVTPAPSGLDCSNGAASGAQWPGVGRSVRANELSLTELQQFCAEAAREVASLGLDPAFVAAVCADSLNPAYEDACRARYAQDAVAGDPAQIVRCQKQLAACDRTVNALALCAYDQIEITKQNVLNRLRNNSNIVLYSPSCIGWMACAAASGVP